MTRKTTPENLWVMLDSQRRVIHQTFDEGNVAFMMELVSKAVIQGDDWRLIKFVKEADLTGEAA